MQDEMGVDMQSDAPKDQAELCGRGLPAPLEA
jgi:hypothetical protein